MLFVSQTCKTLSGGGPAQGGRLALQFDVCIRVQGSNHCVPQENQLLRDKGTNCIFKSDSIRDLRGKLWRRKKCNICYYLEENPLEIQVVYHCLLLKCEIKLQERTGIGYNSAFVYNLLRTQPICKSLISYLEKVLNSRSRNIKTLLSPFSCSY